MASTDEPVRGLCSRGDGQLVRIQRPPPPPAPALLATPGARGSTLLPRQPLARCGTVPGSGKPVLVGVGDGLGSLADAGLGEDMIDVALYCGLADHQLVR